MIDNCKYSFRELAIEVLPEYMKKMREAIKRSYPMTRFAIKGDGPKTILKQLGREKDFSGCYVFLKEEKPVYVGISRSVVQRLIQHVKGRTHYDASLAYRIASENYPIDMHMQRSEAMTDERFRIKFEEAKAYIRSLSVSFIEIENDLELYLFEAYCALELNTFKWNTFRTH